ncbi:hypothetical protein B0H13DRAFT_2689462 [Mycena leptocephala]|nr:hypothetical protein B0H13DRAFT_2689462 [Mycena leptocephala]
MRCRRLHARTPCLLASATSLRKFGTMIGLETPKGDGSQTRPPVPVQKEIGVAGPGCPAGKQAASGVSLERTSLHSRHLRSPARFFLLLMRTQHEMPQSDPPLVHLGVYVLGITVVGIRDSGAYLSLQQEEPVPQQGREARRQNFDLDIRRPRVHRCAWIEIARTRCTHIGSLRFTPHHPDLQQCEGLRASARPDHAATGRGSMPLIIAGPELRKGSAGRFRCKQTLFPACLLLLPAVGPPLLLRYLPHLWAKFLTRLDTCSFYTLHLLSARLLPPTAGPPPRVVLHHRFLFRTSRVTINICPSWYDTARRRNLLKIGTVLDSGKHTVSAFFPAEANAYHRPPRSLPASDSPSHLVTRASFPDSAPHALYLRHLHLLAARLPLPAVGSLPLPRYCDTSSHSLAQLTLFNTSTSSMCLLPPAVGPLPLPAVLRYLLVVSLSPRSLTPCTFSPRVSSLPPSVLFSRWFCVTSPSSRLLARSTLFNTLLSARLLPPAVGPLLLPAVQRHLFHPLLYNMIRSFLHSSSSRCASSLPPSVLFLYRRYHTPLTTRRLPFPHLPPPAAGSPLTCGNATPYPRPFSDATLLLLPSLLRNSSIPTIPAIPLLGFDSLGVPLYQILRLYYPHALALPHLCIISFPLAFAVASLSFGCFPMFVWSCFRVSSRVVSACSVFCLSLASSAILLSARIASIPGQVGHLCAGRDTHLYSRAKASISSPFSSRVINCSIAQAANNYASKR